MWDSEIIEKMYFLIGSMRSRRSIKPGASDFRLARASEISLSRASYSRSRSGAPATQAIRLAVRGQLQLRVEVDLNSTICGIRNSIIPEFLQATNRWPKSLRSQGTRLLLPPRLFQRFLPLRTYFLLKILIGLLHDFGPRTVDL